MRKILRFISRTSGMTLIEIMIATGLSAVMVLGIASYMNGMTEGLIMQRAVKGRDEVAARVGRSSGDPRALLYSSTQAGNVDLQTCITAGGCAVGTYPLTLYEPINGNTAPMSLPTGGGQGPLRYTIDGAPCPIGTPVGTQCPIEVDTQFVYETVCF